MQLLLKLIVLEVIDIEKGIYIITNTSIRKIKYKPFKKAAEKLFKIEMAEYGDLQAVDFRGYLRPLNKV